MPSYVAIHLPCQCCLVCYNQGMTDNAAFKQIETDLASGGAEAVWLQLTGRLRRENRFHELFDARLSQVRGKLGLPLYASGELDRLPEPVRSQVEEGYLAACREVGELLVAAGKLREAWMYLRPAGESQRLKAAIEQTVVDDENGQELIELALYEGISPGWGFDQLLKQRGTCNAISTFESIAPGLDRAGQQQLATQLVRHLHGELWANLAADLLGDSEGRERTGDAENGGLTPPARLDVPPPLMELLDRIEGPFGEYYCHVDASHLGAIVRYGRLLTAAADVRLAWELTQYGRRLHENFRHAGEEPFTDTFEHHALLFAAQLGNHVDEALAHFAGRAAEVDIRQQGTAAVEVYATLLARLGRPAEAIRVMATVPAGISTSRFAPSLLELSEQAGEFSTYQDVCRQRGDLLGYAIGRLEEVRRQKAEVRS